MQPEVMADVKVRVVVVSRYRMSSIDDIFALFQVITFGIKFEGLNLNYTLK